MFYTKKCNYFSERKNFVLDSFKEEIFDFKVKRQGLIAGTVVWHFDFNKSCVENKESKRYKSLETENKFLNPIWMWDQNNTKLNL